MERLLPQHLSNLSHPSNLFNNDGVKETEEMHNKARYWQVVSEMSEPYWEERRKK